MMKQGLYKVHSLRTYIMYENRAHGLSQNQTLRRNQLLKTFNYLWDILKPSNIH